MKIELPGNEYPMNGQRKGGRVLRLRPPKILGDQLRFLPLGFLDSDSHQPLFVENLQTCDCGGIRARASDLKPPPYPSGNPPPLAGLTR